MSVSNPKTARLTRQRGGEGRKSGLAVLEPEPVFEGDDGEVEVGDPCLVNERVERRLVRKIDVRLCTIAGILCSLNLLIFRSGIISSASVTSIFGDLGLGVGNRYVGSIHVMIKWGANKYDSLFQY